mgnify:CR=1 FL=1
MPRSCAPAGEANSTAPEASIASRAKAQGISPEELAYDILAAGSDGGRLYLAMANFAEGSLDAVGGMLDHPDVVLGLGDGGAHVATICDASYSTFALTHWVRDRSHGRKRLEDVVHRMSGATARLMGLDDRGVERVGSDTLPEALEGRIERETERTRKNRPTFAPSPRNSLISASRRDRLT